MRPAAILLAGGTARRMGGGDKSLHILAGRPILSHVIGRIQPQVAALALNANGDPVRFAAWDLPVIADEIGGYPGPLAGIHAGMNWARERFPEISEILSIPTDLPFLPTDLVERLQAARIAENADIAVARSNDQPHPVVALWPIGVADALHRAVTQEALRRVTEFAGRYRVAYADFAVVSTDPFYNINSPDELQRAQSLAD
ncbi:MAG: molybdopterin-guanine dinucleotide biosynthesis protein [Rhodospirillales bacterium]|nr:molybdopterin-guanine dinucleotide biosynthesis protein [Rhodospirillales bacterium]